MLRLPAFLLLLAVAAPAAAQVPNPYVLTSDGVQVSPMPIIPEEASATVRIDLKVVCTAPAPPSLDPATVQATVTAPPYVVVTGPVTQQVTPPDCVTESERAAEFTFDLLVTRDAPGQTPLPVDVRFTYTPGGAVPQDAPEDIVQRFTVVAQYVPLLDVQAATKIIEVHGDVATAAIDVANLGNAKTTVSGVATASAGNVTVEPIALDSPNLPPATDGHDHDHGAAAPPVTAGRVPVLFRAPEGGWDEAAVQVTLTPISALDPQQVGAPTVVNLLFRRAPLDVEGDEKESSGVPAALVPLGLALLAVALRRR